MVSRPDVPPDNMNDWMRWVEARIRSLERHRHPVLNQGFVALGDWSVQEAENGDLIAVHPSGAQVVLGEPDSPAEESP